MRISSKQLQANGTEQLIKQQAAVSKTQSQLASGKRILTPSDDTLGSNMVLRFEQEIKISEGYIRVADQAEGLVELEETVLNSLTDLLFTTRNSIIRAGNGNYSTNERLAIAEEIAELRKSAIALANTQTASGEYLFSGFATLTKPFTQDAAGNIVYNGDQGQRLAKVNDTVTIATSDSGYEVFERSLNGNGIIQVSQNLANVGSGVIDPGSVDRASYVSDTYTISFVTNNNGELAYNVFGALSGQVIPVPPDDPTLDAPAYTEGEDISFNGITTNITGTPDAVAGDSFTVEPSTRQNIFDTLQNVIDGLRLPSGTAAERALFQNTLNSSLMDIDQGMANIDRVRSGLGARLNAITNEKYVNEDMIISVSKEVSKIRDLDYAEAATRLSLQITTLEAAQASFARIQNLSLFNYL